MDPSRPGPEVAISGYSRAVQLAFRESGKWRAVHVAELPGFAKGAILTFRGVAFACMGGSVTLLQRQGREWNTEILSRADAGFRRVGTDGFRLLVSRDDGVLSLGEPGGGWKEVLQVPEDRLKGGVIDDLDPAAPGLELATCSTKAIYVLRLEGAAWKPEALWKDEKANLHHMGGRSLMLAACGAPGIAGPSSHAIG